MKINKENGNSSPWLQHIVGPIVVGLVVLLGQFFIQPKITERGQARTEHWEAKRESYVKCLNLVNKKFLSITWQGKDGVDTTPHSLGAPPTIEEANQCYAELSLFTTDTEVLSLFIKCFGESTDRKVEQQDRIRLIQAMRKDLGFEQMQFNPELVKLFVLPW